MLADATQIQQEIRDEVAAMTDDLALQNGEITHDEHAHREWVRQYNAFWAGGQVGTD